MVNQTVEETNNNIGCKAEIRKGRLPVMQSVENVEVS
jgi:hypothetical protein